MIRRQRWFKRNRPFRRKTKTSSSACAITFQLDSTSRYSIHVRTLWSSCMVFYYCIFLQRRRNKLNCITLFYSLRLTWVKNINNGNRTVGTKKKQRRIPWKTLDRNVSREHSIGIKKQGTPNFPQQWKSFTLFCGYISWVCDFICEREFTLLYIEPIS